MKQYTSVCFGKTNPGIVEKTQSSQQRFLVFQDVVGVAISHLLRRFQDVIKRCL